MMGRRTHNSSLNVLQLILYFPCKGTIVKRHICKCMSNLLQFSTKGVKKVIKLDLKYCYKQLVDSPQSTKVGSANVKPLLRRTLVRQKQKTATQHQTKHATQQALHTQDLQIPLQNLTPCCSYKYTPKQCLSQCGPLARRGQASVWIRPCTGIA